MCVCVCVGGVRACACVCLCDVHKSVKTLSCLCAQTLITIWILCFWLRRDFEYLSFMLKGASKYIIFNHLQTSEILCKLYWWFCLITGRHLHWLKCFFYHNRGFYNIHLDNMANNAKELDTLGLWQYLKEPPHTQGHTLDLVISKDLNISGPNHFCVSCRIPDVQWSSVSVHKRNISKSANVMDIIATVKVQKSFKRDKKQKKNYGETPWWLNLWKDISLKWLTGTSTTPALFLSWLTSLQTHQNNELLAFLVKTNWPSNPHSQTRKQCYLCNRLETMSKLNTTGHKTLEETAIFNHPHVLTQSSLTFFELFLNL